MDYKRMNTLVGWGVFLIATTVYFMTIEPTTSLWDCGEYITTAYKLEVGHPPGAPLFMMLGRLFTIFASPESAAMMINVMSGLCSSFTVLFLFWTITMIAKKVVLSPGVKLFTSNQIDDEITDIEDDKKKSDQPKEEKRTLTEGYKWAILGSGFIGALAYTFTDSFWFSAVEGEVYAMSSFFTALVFWAIFKWDHELQDQEDDPENAELQSKNANRWLVFIFFMIGLSIGVHLLNLLCIPAIAYVIYFRKFKKPTVAGFFITGIIGVATLGIIQSIVIPKTVQLAGWFERIFVNKLGMPFNSGSAVFLLMITFLTVGAILLTKRKALSREKRMIIYIGAALVGTLFLFIAFMDGQYGTAILTVLVFGGIALGKVLIKKDIRGIMETIVWSATMILIGYSCFAMIVIRSEANPPLDENNPENLVSLEAYLKREQYGDWPIMYGPYFNSDFYRTPSGSIDYTTWDDRSDVYLRRYVVMNAVGEELKGFQTEAEAKEYQAKVGGSIEEKYYQTFDGTNAKPRYRDDECTFFPRMYSPEPRHVSGYKSWTGHVGDGLPSFGQNLTYFAQYQVGWMYWRYFMWNFSGRQNDEQGHGNARDGNWMSGLNFIDKHHIGDQSEAPSFITENPSHNKFYMLPLLLGLMGFIFMLTKATSQWWIVMLLFLLTGFAIIIYLNQKPIEPRERDYAYAASFYAFAIWIGMGVLALFDAFKSMQWKELMYIAATLIGLGVVFAVTDLTAAMSMFYMGGLITGLFALMIALRSGIKKDYQAGIISLVLALPVPLIMAEQSWDDHDRSGRYTARDLAYNYLISCTDGSVVFTNGDNDTFPLWYLQEVEEVKTSVRVCNLSLLNTDWYTEQMTRQAYDSDPLPISFTEEQYRQNGARDYMYVAGTNDLTMGSATIPPKWKSAIDVKIASQQELFKPAFAEASQSLYTILGATKFPELQPDFYNELAKFDSTHTYYEFRNLVFNLISEESYEKYAISQEQAQAIFETMIKFNDAFDYMDAKDAMAFLGDDSNIENRGGNKLLILPTRGLSLKVDKEKVLANGIVAESEADRIVDVMRWKIPKSSLYKADLMILDIVAHHDWNRGIYFASSADPQTYLGLSKYFFSEGLVYHLVPIEVEPTRNPNSLGEVNEEKMYENLMVNFRWGNMNDPDVLVDYYNRRLTNNYRVQFSVLADAYTKEYEYQEQKQMMLREIMGQEIEQETIQTPIGMFNKSEIPGEIEKCQAIMDTCAIRTSEVIGKSVEVMPHFNVPFGRVFPSYIQALYTVGDFEKAQEYSSQLMDLFEEELNYYMSVDPEFSSTMLDDMFTAFRGCFSIYQAVGIYDTDEDFTNTITTRFYTIMENTRVSAKEIATYSTKAQSKVKTTFEAFYNQLMLEW